MTYTELQNALKEYRDQNLTTVKLNSKKETLQAEYDRLLSLELETISTGEEKVMDTTKEIIISTKEELDELQESIDNQKYSEENQDVVSNNFEEQPSVWNVYHKKIVEKIMNNNYEGTENMIVHIEKREYAGSTINVYWHNTKFRYQLDGKLSKKEYSRLLDARKAGEREANMREYKNPTVVPIEIFDDKLDSYYLSKSKNDYMRYSESKKFTGFLMAMMIPLLFIGITFGIPMLSQKNADGKCPIHRGVGRRDC